jgi:hypothetical protein
MRRSRKVRTHRLEPGLLSRSHYRDDRIIVQLAWFLIQAKYELIRQKPPSNSLRRLSRFRVLEGSVDILGKDKEIPIAWRVSSDKGRHGHIRPCVRPFLNILLGGSIRLDYYTTLGHCTPRRICGIGNNCLLRNRVVGRVKSTKVSVSVVTELNADLYPVLLNRSAKT